MRETTQGSKHKLYGYKCKRVKYDTPVERAGIKFHYYNKCTRVRIPTEKCPKSHKSSGSMVGVHSKMLRSKKHHSKHHSTHKSKPKSLTKKMTNTMRKTVASLKKSVSRMM